MAGPKKTLYEILGLARDANDVDIGLAHQRRVAEMRRAVPPDPSAEALVQQAFEVLSDARRRAAYDAQLLTAAERSAAAEQATPDFEIGEDEPARRKLPVAVIAAIAGVVVVALFFALRSPAPDPAPVAEAPPPQAPQAPPPPRPRTASEIVGSAATSIGRVMVYAMSGAVTPIGLAVATEPGTMITTCHAIPAGGSLVVRVGKEQHPADLTITDEALDLCRLSVAGFSTPPVKVATEDPKVGDKLYTLAFNTKGEVAAAEGPLKSMRTGPLLELSTPVAGNASGGPVFDEFGTLVGIATARHAFGPGVHAAVPATAIAQMRSRTK